MVRILVLSVSLAMLATPARAAGRNVVFFVADDHGTEALGAYGNRVVKTPSLDQLASEGVRFTHAFATTASCSASRSVLLTGVHNHRNGQYGHEHEYHHFSAFPNVRSLPVLLAEAGYRTARGGKFHVAPRTSSASSRSSPCPRSRPSSRRTPPSPSSCTTARTSHTGPSITTRKTASIPAA